MWRTLRHDARQIFQALAADRALTGLDSPWLSGLMFDYIRYERLEWRLLPAPHIAL